MTTVVEIEKVYIQEIERIRNILQTCKLDELLEYARKEIEKIYQEAIKCLEKDMPYDCFKSSNIVQETPFTNYVFKIASILLKTQLEKGHLIPENTIFDIITHIRLLYSKLCSYLTKLDRYSQSIVIYALISFLLDICKLLNLKSSMCLVIENLDIINTIISVNEVKKKYEKS